MSRKPKKGYYVKGQFVAEGSELDLQLKAELKGTDEASRTDLKKESDALQKLGESLLTLRADLLKGLQLPDKLVDAVAEAKRITNFEGKRRQLQFVGKLMRKLSDEAFAAVCDAITEQREGSSRVTLALHEAEQWRDRLVKEDTALDEWMQANPSTDSQQLRALIRQARKDDTTSKADVAKGLLPRQGRAYREIFQLVKSHLGEEGDIPAPEDFDD